MLTRRQVLYAMAAPFGGTATPEDFGAVGDGQVNDEKAFRRLSHWLSEGSYRTAVLTRRYRIGRRDSPETGDWLREGAITVRNPRKVSIDFRGGELLMDNLTPEGRGDQFHGILVEGPGDGVELKRPKVSWSNRPSLRSQGDGIRIHGTPSAQGAISDVRITDSEVRNSPQAGLLLVACQDVQITAHRSVATMADGFHANACGQVRGGLIRGEDTGDDVCAFVTYGDAVPRPIYGQEETDPWAVPGYGMFSDSDCTVQRVEAVRSSASGLRLAGCAGVRVGVVQAFRTGQAVIADGGLAGGGYGWTNLQPTQCEVGQILADRCDIGLHVRSFNVTPGKGDRRLYRVGLRVRKLRAMGCQQSMIVHDVEGLTLDEADIDGGSVEIRSVGGARFGRLALSNAAPSTISRQARSQIRDLILRNAQIRYLD
jgi:hypothetical protein